MQRGFKWWPGKLGWFQVGKGMVRISDPAETGKEHAPWVSLTLGTKFHPVHGRCTAGLIVFASPKNGLFFHVHRF